jgi:hypothetical protein
MMRTYVRVCMPTYFRSYAADTAALLHPTHLAKFLDELVHTHIVVYVCKQTIN